MVKAGEGAAGAGLQCIKINMPPVGVQREEKHVCWIRIMCEKCLGEAAVSYLENQQICRAAIVQQLRGQRRCDLRAPLGRGRSQGSGQSMTGRQD